MVKDELLDLLQNLELSTRLTNVDVQEAFLELAYELFLMNFNYQGVDFQISEIEFGSSRLKDKLHCNEEQLTLGRTYVHKAKNVTLFAGFDITCGSGTSNGSYGAILVKAIRINGKEVPSTNLALRAILGISEGRDKKSEEEVKRFSDFNNHNIFELFTISKLIDTAVIEDQFRYGTRVTLVGAESETAEERSGVLLRATNLTSPKAKKDLLSIGESVPTFEEEEDSIQDETTIVTFDPVFKKAINKKKQEAGYTLAEKRYASLIERTYLNKLESFLYIKIYVQKRDDLTFEDFKSFDFSDEYQAQMLQDYNNVSVLRAKNKLFGSVKNKYKTLFKEIKNHVRAEFDGQLNKNEFTDNFFFKDEERIKRVCGYCGVNEEEIKKLFDKKQVFTKRQYSRGKTLEVDKKDPNDFYRINNIILACYWCNNAKTDEFTDDEFKSIGTAIRKVWEQRLKH